MRVIRVTRRAEGISHDTGHVSLGVPDAWQTVFRGNTPRRYRIRCDRGGIQVALDGALVEELQPGQTSDFEGDARACARPIRGGGGGRLLANRRGPVIRSIAFVLAVSAARDPIAALRTQVVPVDPAVVHDTNRPPHLEPFRSFVYSPADIHLGAWPFRNALRMTPAW